MNGLIKISNDFVVEGMVAVNIGYGNVANTFDELFYIFAEEFNSVGRYATVYGIRDGDDAVWIDGNCYAQVYVLRADIANTLTRNDYHYQDVEYDDWEWVSMEEYEGNFVSVDVVKNDGNVALV